MGLSSRNQTDPFPAMRNLPADDPMVSAKRPGMKDISAGRWLTFMAVSLVSGVVWACLMMALFDFGPSVQRMPSILLAGAISGLVVGALMNWFYRSPSPIPTVLSTPLAYYLGAFLFMVLDALMRQYTDPKLLIVMAAYALFIFMPPLVLFMPVVWLNGVLLRWILRGFPLSEP
jgi:ABC-type Na+ efflux pump permease subunit